MLRITLAALHLIALGLGLGAVIARGTALRESPSNAALRRAFRSDTTWGIAALLWIVTGVWRLVTGIEKPTAYYLANPVFHAEDGAVPADPPARGLADDDAHAVAARRSAPASRPSGS